MKTERPKGIKILGIKHDIKFKVPNFEHTDVYGETLLGECIINVNDEKGLTEEHKAGVLIHEILEAINYRLELDLEHPQITALDAAITQVILDNPQLIQYFKEVTDSDVQ